MKHQYKIIVVPLIICFNSISLAQEFSANTLFNKAEILRSAGNIDGAISTYRHAIDVDPLHFEANFFLANELFRRGNYHESIHYFEQAIISRPDSVRAFFNLAVAYMQCNNYAQAEQALQKTLQLDPTHQRVHLLLGITLQKLQKFNDAIVHFNKALEQNPQSVEAYFGLGQIYRSQNNTAQACAMYEKALAIRPHDIFAHFDLAYMLNQLGSYEQSLYEFNKVLEIDHNCIDALTNKAHILRTLGRWEESLPCYERSLSVYRDNGHIHYGFGESLLAMGTMPQGWHEFEWRTRRAPDTRNLLSNQWDGSDIHGKTILLRAEYGLGDTLQFVRYAKILKEQGAKIMIEAQNCLVPLLSLCPYLDNVVPLNGPFPPHDVQLPIMSFPDRFKTTLDTIPQEIPYLYANPILAKEWAAQLSKDTNIKIGICWEASPYYNSLRSSLSQKSIPLALFEVLTKIEGVSLYSLQAVDGLDQLNNLPQGMIVRTFGPQFDVNHGAFMDTAAVMKNLDLLITVDTSVTHLAGALGIPVWVMLPYVADWRWMVDRTDTPWYPTMRLFRQQSPGNWQQVMAHVAQELQAFCNTYKRVDGIVTAEISVGELIDKITILEIKQKEIKDPKKLRNVVTELESLNKTRSVCVPCSPIMNDLKLQLLETNKRLWVIEDAIRDKERLQQFDQEFIQLARDVYFVNDHRCKIKRHINDAVGSRLVEEKSYQEYLQPAQS